MNKFHAIIFIFVLALVACNKDNDALIIDPSNENANYDISNSYAHRLEIPRLKDTSKNLFLVHKLSNNNEVNFCVEWDKSKLSQRWTAYQLYASNSVKNWNRNDWNATEWGGDPFQIDPSIPTLYQSTLDMYRGSGYNRGHICPSADRLASKEANEQTYYLSNMQPQVYGFNAGVWLNMENWVRSYNVNSKRDTLYVVKGGTIDKSGEYSIRTDKNNLIVPKYFWMAILCKNASGYKAMAFWAEHKVNSDTNLSKYVISVDELEQKTGIDFFCNLPDAIEEDREKNLSKTAWGFSN